MDTQLPDHGPAEFAAQVSGTRGRVDRPVYSQRRRDLHAGVDGSYSARDANRREYAGRIFRCPGPAAAQRVDLRPAERSL